MLTGWPWNWIVMILLIMCNSVKLVLISSDKSSWIKKSHYNQMNLHFWPAVALTLLKVVVKGGPYEP